MSIHYDDLMDLDLKKYEVPMLLSRKLVQLANQVPDYWTLPFLECAQHAYKLEELIQKQSSRTAI